MTYNWPPLDIKIANLTHFAKKDPQSGYEHLVSLLATHPLNAEAALNTSVLQIIAEKDSRLGYEGIKAFLRANAEIAPLIFKTGILKTIAERSDWYGYKAVETLLEAKPDLAQAIFDSGIVQTIAENYVGHAYYALEALLKAKPDLAQEAYDSGIVQIFMESNQQTGHDALKALINLKPDLAKAKLDNGFVQTIGAKNEVSDYLTLKNHLEAESDLILQFAQDPAFIKLASGIESCTNFLSEQFHQTAQKAEAEGKLDKLNITKIEKGYLFNDFQLAVSHISPESGLRTMMIIDPKTKRPHVMVGSFAGSLDDFRKSIFKTYPDKLSKDRKHYDAVHTMLSQKAKELRWHVS